MSWQVKYLPEAAADLQRLDGSQRILVRKAIEKVRQNPLPFSEGGYGKPLGNKGTAALAGFLKVKLKKSGIRIVYTLKKIKDGMLIIVIGARAEDEVYEEANNRIIKHELKEQQ